MKIYNFQKKLKYEKKFGFWFLYIKIRTFLKLCDGIGVDIFDWPKFFLLPEMHLRKKYERFNFGIHHLPRSVYIFKKLTKFPHFELKQRISKKPFLRPLMVLEGIGYMALPHTIQQPILCLDRQNETLSNLLLAALRPLFDEKLGIFDLGKRH